jgi:hypothetical protein
VHVMSTAFDDDLRIAFLAITPLSYLGAAILFHARRFLDEDMNKIMLAVLEALQHEKEREAERELERAGEPGPDPAPDRT